MARTNVLGAKGKRRIRPLGSFPTVANGKACCYSPRGLVHNVVLNDDTPNLRNVFSKSSISTEDTEDTRDIVELFAELDAVMDDYKEKAMAKNYGGHGCANYASHTDGRDEGFFVFNDAAWNEFSDPSYYYHCHLRQKQKPLSKFIQQGVQKVLQALGNCDGRAAWEHERNDLLEELQRERIKAIALEHENEELLAYTGRAEF